MCKLESVAVYAGDGILNGLIDKSDFKGGFLFFSTHPYIYL